MFLRAKPDPVTGEVDTSGHSFCVKKMSLRGFACWLVLVMGMQAESKIEMRVLPFTGRFYFTSDEIRRLH
jgi:hypothetical protein